MNTSSSLVLVLVELYAPPSQAFHLEIVESAWCSPYAIDTSFDFESSPTSTSHQVKFDDDDE